MACESSSLTSSRTQDLHGSMESWSLDHQKVLNLFFHVVILIYGEDLPWDHAGGDAFYVAWTQASSESCQDVREPLSSSPQKSSNTAAVMTANKYIQLGDQMLQSPVISPFLRRVVSRSFTPHFLL